tara:strand:+ start:205 stop:1461 length:1257 start_codon:yes stop_codon:yes gene_type:complete
VAINQYTFDDIVLPVPPVYVPGEVFDYTTNKLPKYLKSQYTSMLDLISAIQSAFLVSNEQISGLDADKITNNTQFTQSVFVGAESKIKLDGVNNQITITDNQGSPVTRVILGKLSSATDDYGLKVINDSGDVKFQTGSTTFIDGGIITANTVTATQIAADTITATQIAADTITATELAANSVTASEINVSQLSAIAADLGTVTAGTITGGTIQTASSGQRLVVGSTGLQAINSSGTTVVTIGNDGQFRFGPSSGDNVSWNNTTLSVTGDIIATGNIQDGAITNPVVTTGTSSDGSNVDLVVSTKGGNIVATISVVAVVRGLTAVGTGLGNMRVQIDGNTFKNVVGSKATSGGGSVVVPQNTDGQTCTGTFLDGDPAGSIGSAANTTYTVAVDITDVITDTTLSVQSYTVKLVTLETFK